MLPRRPRQIEQVGKASIVDLHAALYASEESKRLLQDPAARAAAEERRRHARSIALGSCEASPLLFGANRGVAARIATDMRADSSEEMSRQVALRQKAAIYEQLTRGEEAESKTTRAHSLVDFELKQLVGSSSSLPLDEFGRVARGADEADEELAPQPSDEFAPPPSLQRQPPPPLEAGAARHEVGEFGRREQVGSHERGAKRISDELAVGAQTAASRSAAMEQKVKRQRALDARRAFINMKQQARVSAEEQQ